MKVNKNKNIFSDLLEFLKKHKAWWLIPLIIQLCIVGALIILGQSNVISPFIYAVF